MYGSEAWTTYARHEKRLNVFHLRNLRRILGITWQDKVPNSEVLSQANLPSMNSLLKQRRLRWLGHVSRMEDSRIPKTILYSELREGGRTRGRPKLRYRDVVKRDMIELDMDVKNWETLAADRPKWRLTLKKQLESNEQRLKNAATEKRARRKERVNVNRPASNFICDLCGRDCHARIGLSSHRRRCTGIRHHQGHHP